MTVSPMGSPYAASATERSTAMPGKRQKPASQLQGYGSRYRGTTATILPQAVALAVPPCPAGISAAARKVWESFWDSPVAPTVDMRCDAPALARWIIAFSEVERLRRQIRKHPTVTGSMGQPVLNPIHDIMRGYIRDMERAEEHFGMTPLARMRLGIAIGEAGLSLQALKDSLGATSASAVAQEATQAYEALFSEG